MNYRIGDFVRLNDKAGYKLNHRGMLLEIAGINYDGAAVRGQDGEAVFYFFWEIDLAFCPFPLPSKVERLLA